MSAVNSSTVNDSDLSKDIFHQIMHSTFDSGQRSIRRRPATAIPSQFSPTASEPKGNTKIKASSLASYSDKEINRNRIWSGSKLKTPSIQQVQSGNRCTCRTVSSGTTPWQRRSAEGEKAWNRWPARINTSIRQHQQEQRLLNQLAVIDQCRRMRQEAERAQHRVDARYYICGSQVPLLDRYNVSEADIQRQLTMAEVGKELKIGLNTEKNLAMEVYEIGDYEDASQLSKNLGVAAENVRTSSTNIDQPEQQSKHAEKRHGSNFQSEIIPTIPLDQAEAESYTVSQAGMQKDMKLNLDEFSEELTQDYEQAENRLHKTVSNQMACKLGLSQGYRFELEKPKNTKEFMFLNRESEARPKGARINEYSLLHNHQPDDSCCKRDLRLARLPRCPEEALKDEHSPLLKSTKSEERNLEKLSPAVSYGVLSTSQEHLDNSEKSDEDSCSGNSFSEKSFLHLLRTDTCEKIQEDKERSIKLTLTKPLSKYYDQEDENSSSLSSESSISDKEAERNSTHNSHSAGGQAKRSKQYPDWTNVYDKFKRTSPKNRALVIATGRAEQLGKCEKYLPLVMASRHRLAQRDCRHVWALRKRPGVSSKSVTELARQAFPPKEDGSKLAAHVSSSSSNLACTSVHFEKQDLEKVHGKARPPKVDTSRKSEEITSARKSCWGSTEEMVFSCRSDDEQPINSFHCFPSSDHFSYSSQSDKQSPKSGYHHPYLDNTQLRDSFFFLPQSHPKQPRDKHCPSPHADDGQLTNGCYPSPKSDDKQLINSYHSSPWSDCMQQKQNVYDLRCWSDSSGPLYSTRSSLSCLDDENKRGWHTHTESCHVTDECVEPHTLSTYNAVATGDGSSFSLLSGRSTLKDKCTKLLSDVHPSCPPAKVEIDCDGVGEREQSQSSMNWSDDELKQGTECIEVLSECSSNVPKLELQFLASSRSEKQKMSPDDSEDVTDQRSPCSPQSIPIRACSSSMSVEKSLTHYSGDASLRQEINDQESTGENELEDVLVCESNDQMPVPVSAVEVKFGAFPRREPGDSSTDDNVTQKIGTVKDDFDSRFICDEQKSPCLTERILQNEIYEEFVNFKSSLLNNFTKLQKELGCKFDHILNKPRYCLPPRKQQQDKGSIVPHKSFGVPRKENKLVRISSLSHPTSHGASCDDFLLHKPNNANLKDNSCFGKSPMFSRQEQSSDTSYCSLSLDKEAGRHDPDSFWTKEDMGERSFLHLLKAVKTLENCAEKRPPGQEDNVQKDFLETGVPARTSPELSGLGLDELDVLKLYHQLSFNTSSAAKETDSSLLSKNPKKEMPGPVPVTSVSPSVKIAQTKFPRSQKMPPDRQNDVEKDFVMTGVAARLAPRKASCIVLDEMAFIKVFQDVCSDASGVVNKPPSYLLPRMSKMGQAGIVSATSASCSKKAFQNPMYHTERVRSGRQYDVQKDFLGTKLGTENGPRRTVSSVLDNLVMRRWHQVMFSSNGAACMPLSFLLPRTSGFVRGNGFTPLNHKQTEELKVVGTSLLPCPAISHDHLSLSDDPEAPPTSPVPPKLSKTASSLNVDCKQYFQKGLLSEEKECNCSCSVSGNVVRRNESSEKSEEDGPKSSETLLCGGSMCSETLEEDTSRSSKGFNLKEDTCSENSKQDQSRDDEGENRGIQQSKKATFSWSDNENPQKSDMFAGLHSKKTLCANPENEVMKYFKTEELPKPSCDSKVTKTLISSSTENKVCNSLHRRQTFQGYSLPQGMQRCTKQSDLKLGSVATVEPMQLLCSPLNYQSLSPEAFLDCQQTILRSPKKSSEPLSGWIKMDLQNENLKQLPPKTRTSEQALSLGENVCCNKANVCQSQSSKDLPSYEYTDKIFYTRHSIRKGFNKKPEVQTGTTEVKSRLVVYGKRIKSET